MPRGHEIWEKGGISVHHMYLVRPPFHADVVPSLRPSEDIDGEVRVVSAMPVGVRIARRPQVPSSDRMLSRMRTFIPPLCRREGGRRGPDRDVRPDVGRREDRGFEGMGRYAHKLHPFRDTPSEEEVLPSFQALRGNGARHTGSGEVCAYLRCGKGPFALPPKTHSPCRKERHPRGGIPGH